MTHVILFYKYTPLSSNPNIMAMYQKAMQDLCSTLKLTGRVLIGMSDDAEGINGTLAGDDEKNVLAYTYAMLGPEWCSKNDTQDLLMTSNDLSIADESIVPRGKAVCDFWIRSKEFADKAGIPMVTVDSSSDFKWSFHDDVDKGSGGLFPDLQIRLVKEVIGTGGVLSSISIKDTSKGYLTPEEWHEEMKKIKDEMSSNGESSTSCDTVLIDCRNHKEFEIGHFEHALDPNTKTFEQFPRWVKENKSALKGKKIFMYCTGGIRCEKASAFVRNELEDDLGTTVVKHLKGGIHKYLERYGANGYWKGKNFVFDRRVGVDANDHVKEQDGCVSDSIQSVGKCLYCAKPHDNFTPDAVCTVCREMTLVCIECKAGLYGEFHCSDHQHLKHCYFTNLSRFSEKELSSQLCELESILEEIAVGKRFRSKRRTLQKQIDRVSENIKKIQNGQRPEICKDEIVCRSCGDTNCDGGCWGVHGLKRKYVLEKSQEERPARNDLNKRISKLQRRERDIDEIKRLGLSKPCSEYRNANTSLRCPPPFVRQLKSLVKGKWVGKSVQSVLQSEFHELGNPERLQLMFQKSLIRVNGIPVNGEAALFKGVDTNRAISQDVLLKNMDVISRITHWHEPPVKVPELIEVQKIQIPIAVLDDNFGSSDNVLVSDEAFFFCCNKPATVPVHPAGPYLQNSLTLMVEAQEGLEPRSLLPCHRLDRCTSGLTLCCTSPAVARLLQVQMDRKLVDKMYLARVKGRFPAKREDMERIQTAFPKDLTWSMSDKNVEVEAPIAIENVLKGLRRVDEHGKNAKSVFRFLDYDGKSDTSLIYASPITGRQHQLRVHLQAIGFPIHNDLLYGGKTVCEEVKKMKSNALDVLTQSAIKDLSSENWQDGISKDSIDAAKSVCLICQGKPEEAFSESQLLCGGHSIDLHAVACRIKFTAKRGREISNTESNDTVGTIDCRLDQYPHWVKIFDGECLDHNFLSR